MHYPTSPSMMITSSLLLVLAGPAHAVDPLQQPTLMLPICPDATLEPGSRQCFSVQFQQGDCAAASVGFTLSYATEALRLPGGNSDVEAGSAVDAADHDFAAFVSEDIDGGGGSLQVSITPKAQFPIPGLTDGEVAKICFTGAEDAPAGCTVLAFTASDVGDTTGHDCAMALPGSGGIQFAESFVPDHYQCYKAKGARGERFEARTVHLQDQFETRVTEVSRPVALCNPADINDAGIYDDLTYLAGYNIKEAKVCADNSIPCGNRNDCNSGARCLAPKHLTQSNLLVENQFGRLLVDTSKADRLLVPGSQDEFTAPLPLEPDAYDVDHFKCYKVRVKKNLCEDDPTLRCKTDTDCPSGACNLGFPKGLEVTIEDEFTPWQSLQVKKPTRLCNPVDKNNEGLIHPETHLMCYQVKLVDTKYEQRTGVNITNQFGDQRLDTTAEEELCVPSQKYHPHR